MTDIVVTGGTELPANTLFFPPDNELLGGKATDWAGNLLPTTVIEARIKAMQTGQPLYNSQDFTKIQDAMPSIAANTNANPTPTLPAYNQIYQPTYQRETGFNLNRWFNNNWKWAVPIAFGFLALVLRR